MKTKIALLIALVCGPWAAAQTANANYPEVQLTPNYAADTGSANVLQVSVTSCPNAYTVGMVIKVLPNHANTTTTPTISLCGIGAKTITKFGQAAVAAAHTGQKIRQD